MKKILVFLFCVVMLITLTACESEDKKEESTPTPVPVTPSPTPNNTVVIDDDEIIDFDDDEDNTPPQGTVTVKEVINCTGCVFAYFDKENEEAVRIGDTISSSDYTTNINNLKTKGGKQRHNFFGLVLDGNKISRASACILKDDHIYCIEGSSNGAYHKSNIGVLKQVFTDDQCKTISAGNTYTCTDGNYNGDTKTTGYVSFLYETGCTVYGGNSSNVGKLICH